MTTIRYTARLGDTWLEDVYAADSLVLSGRSTKSATYVDDRGAGIGLVGTGLKFAGDGSLTSGTVTGVTFIDADGGKLMTATGTRFDAKALYAALEEGETIYAFMTLLTVGKDRIVGTSQGEQFIPGYNGGNDVIFALGGDDFVSASMGSKTMDGGAGFDELSYHGSFYDKANARTGIVLDVVGKTVQNSWGGTDTIRNFESFRGSYLADTMTGSTGDEQFAGLAGKDVIDGGGGYDTVRFDLDARYGGTKGIVANLQAGSARDGFGVIEKLAHIEAARGTDFADLFKGSAGDNAFRGYDGKDRYDGGLGNDTVSFEAGGSHGVVIDMTRASNQVRDDGFGNVETLKSIEIVSGTEASDVIVLGRATMTAFGGQGDDRLTAGTGESRMSGGEGADTFVFQSSSASQAGAPDRDLITDFSQGEGDRIDLTAIGPLTFNGDLGHALGTATIAYYFDEAGRTVISADADGDGTSELQFFLAGTVSLTSDDFIVA